MAFRSMVLGAWFLAYGIGRMVWLWAYSFGRMVIGVWFWVYGFGRIDWTYDLGAQPSKRGQAKLKSIHKHPSIPDGENPKNPSRIALDPGQQARLWCKEIQNLLRFARRGEVSGLSRSGTAACECIPIVNRKIND